MVGCMLSSLAMHDVMVGDVSNDTHCFLSQWFSEKHSKTARVANVGLAASTSVLRYSQPLVMDISFTSKLLAGVAMLLRVASSTDFITPNEASTPIILSIRTKEVRDSNPTVSRFFGRDKGKKLETITKKEHSIRGSGAECYRCS